MQQTIGLKRYVSTHVGPVVLAFGVLVSVTLGVAGLGITGNLPGTADDGSRSDAPQAVVVPMSPAERAVLIQQTHRFYTHKEARLEADELERSVIAARATRQDAMRRYVEHKEETLSAMP